MEALIAHTWLLSFWEGVLFSDFILKVSASKVAIEPLVRLYDILFHFTNA